MQTIKNAFTQRNERGFTLIELLVVIAIIAVLAALVLAALSSAQKGSRDSKRKSDLNQYKTALAQYQSDNNGAYPTAAAITTVAAAAAPCTGLVTTYMATCLTGTTGNPYYYIAPSGDANGFGMCVQLERNSGNYFAVGPTRSGELTGTASTACATQG